MDSVGCTGAGVGLAFVGIVMGAAPLKSAAGKQVKALFSTKMLQSEHTD
jgi:hypothetical protein